jgi:hypothetical protein
MQPSNILAGKGNHFSIPRGRVSPTSSCECGAREVPWSLLKAVLSMGWNMTWQHYRQEDKGLDLLQDLPSSIADFTSGSIILL